MSAIVRINKEAGTIAVPASCTDRIFKPGSKLLDFDGSASLGELILKGFSLFLGNAFLDGLGSALNQFLSVLKTQTSDLANDLDNVQLACAEGSKDNVKLGLFLSGGSGGSSTGNNANRSSSGNTELLFNCLYELRKLQNGQALNSLNYSVNLFRCHF